MSEMLLKKRDLAELGAEALAGLLLGAAGRDGALANWAHGKLAGIGSETLAGTLLSELNDFETLKSRLRRILAEFGVDELAGALIESVRKDAALNSEARRMLAEARENPEEVAAEIREEIESLQPDEILEPWWELESMIGIVEDMIQDIEIKIGLKAPDIAFDLLLSVLDMVPKITDAIFRYAPIGNIDEDSGEELVEKAYQAFLDQARSIAEDPVALADKLFDILKHGADYFDCPYADALRDLADALGEPGLERLKERCDSFDNEPASEIELSESVCAQDQVRNEGERSGSNSAVKAIRKGVADLQVDVDAWIACHEPAELSRVSIATAAASRLLEAGRADEALSIVQNAAEIAGPEMPGYKRSELEAKKIACLEALGRDDELRKALWNRFERTLCSDSLRRHVEGLTASERENALRRAGERVMACSSIDRGLEFCCSFPDLALASRLVLDRSDRLKGGMVGGIMESSAEALRAEYPLAAALLWRTMICGALVDARSKDYKHTSRYFVSCSEVATAIRDYCAHQDHEAFARSLRKKHYRNYAFWRLVAPSNAKTLTSKSSR